MCGGGYTEFETLFWLCVAYIPLPQQLIRCFVALYCNNVRTECERCKHGQHSSLLLVVPLMWPVCPAKKQQINPLVLNDGCIFHGIVILRKPNNHYRNWPVT
jgi:hypothetical protein